MASLENPHANNEVFKIKINFMAPYFAMFTLLV